MLTTDYSLRILVSEKVRLDLTDRCGPDSNRFGVDSSWRRLDKVHSVQRAMPTIGKALSNLTE
jgi:hypothetical protein